MNSQNSTNLSLPATISGLSDLPWYAACGAVVVLVNLLVFAVLFSDRALWRNSALIAGLTLGNFLLGLHLFITGAYRSIYTSASLTPAEFKNCVSIVFPFLYPLAFNCEGAFYFLVGIERFLATAAPTWFRQKWTPRNAWRLAGAGGVFVVITLIAGLLPSYFEHPLLNWQCALTAMYPKSYVNFLSAFSAIGGTCSSCLTIFSLVAGVRRIRNMSTSNGEASRFRKQLQLTKSMMTVSCFDVILVAIPNTLSLLVNLGVALPSFIKGNNTNYTHAVNAVVAIFVYLAFNAKFRKAFLKLSRSEKMSRFIKTAFGFGTTAKEWNQNKITNLPSTTGQQRRQAFTRDTTTAL